MPTKPKPPHRKPRRPRKAPPIPGTPCVSMSKLYQTWTGMPVRITTVTARDGEKPIRSVRGFVYDCGNWRPESWFKTGVHKAYPSGYRSELDLEERDQLGDLRADERVVLASGVLTPLIGGPMRMMSRTDMEALVEKAHALLTRFDPLRSWRKPGMPALKP